MPLQGLPNAYEGDQASGDTKKGLQGELAAEPQPAAADTEMGQIIKTENHILLVLNELCHQMLGAPGGNNHTDEIDLLSVAQRLQESGMSVKQTQRCWELFRKRLRDV